jgi:hypothetical protein
MGILSSNVSVLARIAFRFEVLLSRFIGFYMGRKLKEYNEKGLLMGYKVKSKRRGKYRYLFDVDLSLNIEKGCEVLWLKIRKDT